MVKELENRFTSSSSTSTSSAAGGGAGAAGGISIVDISAVFRWLQMHHVLAGGTTDAVENLRSIGKCVV